MDATKRTIGNWHNDSLLSDLTACLEILTTHLQRLRDQMVSDADRALVDAKFNAARLEAGIRLWHLNDRVKAGRRPGRVCGRWGNLVIVEFDDGLRRRVPSWLLRSGIE